MSGLLELNGLVWIVDTHTGDGHHVFKSLGEVMKYVHRTSKDLTVTAVNPRGKLIFSQDFTSTEAR